MNTFWKALLETLRTRISPSEADLPQTDGKKEVMNRKIEEMMRCLLKYEKSNWDAYVVDFEDAYSFYIQATTTFKTFHLNYIIATKAILMRKLHLNSPTALKFIPNMHEAATKS